MSTYTANTILVIQSFARCIAIAAALSIFTDGSAAVAQTQAPQTIATPVGEDLTKLTDSELEDRIQKERAKLENPQTQPWNAELVKFLTVSVLIFGILVIIIMGYLVLNNSSAGEVLRLFTVPMVIVAAVFLVVTGFSKDQITPVIGLLGTLAAYILGVQSQKGENPTPIPPATKPTSPQSDKTPAPPPA